MNSPVDGSTNSLLMKLKETGTGVVPSPSWTTVVGSPSCTVIVLVTALEP